MESSTPSVAEAWSLSFDDLQFVRNLPTASRLGVAVQLLHFRLHARFFDDWAEIEAEILRYVADQTEADARHATAYKCCFPNYSGLSWRFCPELFRARISWFPE